MFFSIANCSSASKSSDKYKVQIVLGCALSAITNALPSMSQSKPAVPDYTTSEAGNPFVDGWYADPDTAIYDGLYWVYPTSSYAYEEQTYLDAFSSPDLINW